MGTHMPKKQDATKYRTPSTQENTKSFMDSKVKCILAEIKVKGNYRLNSE